MALDFGRYLYPARHAASLAAIAALVVACVLVVLDPTVTQADPVRSAWEWVSGQEPKPVRTVGESWFDRRLGEAAGLTIRLGSLVTLLALLRAAVRQVGCYCAWTRALRLDASRRAPSEPWHAGLTPSQKGYVEDYLRELLLRPHHLYNSKILAVQGSWGSGKTTVIQAMHRALGVHPSLWGLETDVPPTVGFVPAYMNAWRDEDPDDLHERLVERILLRPAILRALGWRMSGLSTRMLRAMRTPIRNEARKTSRWKFRGTLGAKFSGVEGRAQGEFNPLPTRLTHQEDLEFIVAKLGRRRKHLVLFIDEIDRGTPRNAQALMVMLRRALDLQGVHIVMPFVREVLDELAFNPLYQESPELRTSSLAVLASADQNMRSDDVDARRMALGAYEEAAQEAWKSRLTKSDWVGEGKALRQRDMPEKRARKIAANPPADPAPDGTGSTSADRYETYRRRLNDTHKESLVAGYLALDRGNRERFQRRMSEKYIGFFRPLPCVRMIDLAHLVWEMRWLRTRHRMEQLLASALESLDMDRTGAQTFAASFLADRQGDVGVTDEIARHLAFLLSPDHGAPGWPALTTPGAFSLRSFEPYVGQLLAEDVTLPEWPVLVIDRDPDPDPRQVACFVIAQVIFAALILYSFEQSCPPDSSIQRDPHHG